MCAVWVPSCSERRREAGRVLVETWRISCQSESWVKVDCQRRDACWSQVVVVGWGGVFGSMVVTMNDDG